MEKHITDCLQSLTNPDLIINQKQIHRLNRKIFIIRSGFTQAQIAKRLNKKPQAINNEIRGDYRSKEIRLGICEIIGISKETFWPEFYCDKDDKISQAI